MPLHGSGLLACVDRSPDRGVEQGERAALAEDRPHRLRAKGP